MEQDISLCMNRVSANVVRDSKRNLNHTEFRCECKE